MTHTLLRFCRTVGLAVWAALLVAFPTNVLAQEDPEAIDVILGYALDGNVLGDQASVFLQALDQVVGGRIDFVSTGIEPVVREEFDPERLRGHVAEALLETLAPSELEEISVLIRDGAIGQLSDLVAGYEPEESFEVFVQRLRMAPPPPERIELMTQLADAQHAASFYLLLDERVREEAHRVAAIVTGGRSPQYRDLDPAVEREQLQRGRQFAVVSYLHRFGPVEDALVEAATADYGTPAGQRYVEAFSLAVAGSIQLAGLRVAGRLNMR